MRPGEGSGIAPDRELNVLLRVTQNTLMDLTDECFTRINYDGETKNNPTLEGAPNGLLAGHIVVASSEANGAVAFASGASTEQPLGFVLNDALGDRFGSFDGVASGKCAYISGSGSVVGTFRYADVEWKAGDAVYANAEALPSNVGDGPAIGVVLAAPETDGAGQLVIQLLR